MLCSAASNPPATSAERYPEYPIARNAAINRTGVSMTKTHCAAIAVGPMNVAGQRPDFPQGLRDISFLDVHVEQIAEKPNVSRGERAKKTRRIGLPVEDIGLIAIQRFVKQYLTESRRLTAKFL